MKVVKPWTGGLFGGRYKGSRRAKGHQPSAVGKHRKRGSGFFPRAKAPSPLTHNAKSFVAPFRSLFR